MALKEGKLTSEGKAQASVQKLSWLSAIIGAVIAIGPQVIPVLQVVKPEWALIAGALVTIASVFAGQQSAKSLTENRTTLKLNEANNALAIQVERLRSEIEKTAPPPQAE